ncbi:MAG: right-handed parallel beta-helix repeat-containing protein [Phycisphaerales bacterium]
MFRTVLTGEIGVDTDLTDNSFHVVTAKNLTGSNKAVLDGFIIERGYSFGVAGSLHCGNLTAPKNGGAGLDCYNASSLLVRDCVFTCNQALSGAAIRIMCGSSPTIIGCTFEFNFASATGVSDLACGQIPATLGASGNGGAIHIFFEDSSPHIANCTFRHNGAGHDGGAVHAQISAGADVRNCVFFANRAGLAGGGVADIVNSGETPSPCGDQHVDGNDLSVLLGAWGSCPSSLGAGGESASSLLVEMEIGPTPIDVAESMGFASLDEFVAWLTEMDPESMAAWLMTIFGS